MSFFRFFPISGMEICNTYALMKFLFYFFHNTLKIKQEKLDCFGRKILKNGRLFFKLTMFQETNVSTMEVFNASYLK